MSQSARLEGIQPMNETGDALLTMKIEAAFRQAARRVVRLAKQTGTPVIVWENGQVREIPCDQLDEVIPTNQPVKPSP